MTVTTESAAQTPPQPARGRILTAGAFALGGLAAAFGLAACCALPIALGMLGVGGAAWLGGIAFLAGPYQQALLFVAFGCIAVGLVFAYRRPANVCATSAGKPRLGNILNIGLWLIVTKIALWLAAALVALTFAVE